MIYFLVFLALNFCAPKVIHGAGCDVNFVTTSGEIASPDFPLAPSVRRIKCQYDIAAVQGKHIQLQFLEILPSVHYLSYGCARSGLKVYELQEGTWFETAVYCYGDKDIYIPFLSRKNSLRLVYRSRSPSWAFMFRLKFKVVEDLNMELAGQEGLVVSPHFLLNSFPGKTNYSYRIEADKGKKIQLFFTYFGSDIVCANNPLKINDGELASGKPVADVCGRQLKSYLSSSNVISINYMATFPTSTATKTFGFKIYYSTGIKGCDRDFSGGSGRIFSPLHGSLSPKYVNCSYNINTAKGTLILLTMSDYTQPGLDLIRIDDKAGDSGVVSKFDYYSTYYSSGNAVTLHFNSQNQSDNAFFVDYKTTNGCKIDFGENKISGGFSSNNFPSNYTNSMVCNYSIGIPPNTKGKAYVASVFVSTLDLEWSPSCNGDSLSVYDGVDANAKLLERFCGQTKKRTIIGNGKDMFVQFRSNNRLTGRGFRATFLRLPAVCNKTYDFTKRVIKSESFPNQYPNRFACTSTIVGVPGSNVTLNFTHFDLEWSKDCSKDSLKIYEGRVASEALVSTRCGNDVTPFISKSSTVILRFTSDDSVAKTGFNMTYDACRFISKSRNGTFYSPFYPNRYQGKMLCSYLIQVKAGYKVNLVFREFSLHYTYLSTDELKIYDGANSSAPLARTMTKRNRFRRDPFVSNGHSVYLVFRSYQQSYTRLNRFKVDFFENQELCKRLAPCAENGQCEDLPGGKYKCICNDKFITGVNCTDDIGPCSSNPCQNQGNCSNYYYIDGYHCSCPKSFGGLNCDYQYGKYGASGPAPWLIGTIVGVSAFVIAAVFTGIRMCCKRRSAAASQNLYYPPKAQEESLM